MSDGVERRSAIDTETVRGLLLINGGGAVALLAFLSSTITDPNLSSLSRAIIWSIFLFQVGLVSAVVHNRLRRICSLEYSKKAEDRKRCSFFGKPLKEPCVCHWSIGFFWTSIASFLVAGLVVLVAGLCTLSSASIPIPPTAEKTACVAQPPNNAFKLKPLRSGNHMADKACHVVRSTSRTGLA